jgi:MFS family permease
VNVAREDLIARTSIAKPTGWEPLRHPLFRNRWLASIVSNIGSWMQDTAGAWLMTALTSSPLLIALMQTAANLPVLILGLPAGATADMFDRRRLLLFWQTWMLVSVGILSLLTFLGIISPWTLLILTFLLNIGAAMNNPAWQAIVTELVPREELSDAVALNSAGFNLARAVGPALGGLGVAAFVSAGRGAAVVFLLNSISFVAVIYVLYVWKRTPPFKSTLPAERLNGSMRAGVRYLRHSPELQAILWRAFLFAFFAGAVWALLAVVAQQSLHHGAMTYGLLNGCLGIGAVAGASLLPKIRHLLSADSIILLAGGIFTCTLAILGLVRNLPLIVFWLLASGFAWTSVTSTLNAAVQLSVPEWVQARSLGIYQMIFMGGMAGGSALWGDLAEHFSTSKALLAAAIGFACSMPLSHRFHLRQGTPPDMSPYHINRPAPEVELEPLPEDGPVLVMIEYRIEQEDYEPFTHAIHKLRHVRMRDGAVRWGVYRDTKQPGRLVETFVVESWVEFLRERERMTASDREIRDKVRAYHTGGFDPVASYMIYAREIGR